MPEYVILFEKPRFEDSSTIGMTTVENWKKQPDIYADTPIVHERFLAPCWCAAQIHCQRKLHDEQYSMSFCQEDKDKGHELCPHFDKLKKEQEDKK